eukprot:TRINITY_DN39109_c0_g1_i1.p2 TRINITY_DN39109_c0_g1~~TRINITY_DN39109_c0_g1_i1.p2  ORF type:complete len:388 (+),score=123.05 TRINITY_DN39109_c0_g1_i1:27-1166(+)
MHARSTDAAPSPATTPKATRQLGAAPSGAGAGVAQGGGSPRALQHDGSADARTPRGLRNSRTPRVAAVAAPQPSIDACDAAEATEEDPPCSDEEPSVAPLHGALDALEACLLPPALLCSPQPKWTYAEEPTAAWRQRPTGAMPSGLTAPGPTVARLVAARLQERLTAASDCILDSIDACSGDPMLREELARLQQQSNDLESVQREARDLEAEAERLQREEDALAPREQRAAMELLRLKAIQQKKPQPLPRATSKLLVQLKAKRIQDPETEELASNLRLLSAMRQVIEDNYAEYLPDSEDEMTEDQKLVASFVREAAAAASRGSFATIGSTASDAGGRARSGSGGSGGHLVAPEPSAKKKSRSPKAGAGSFGSVLWTSAS